MSVATLEQIDPQPFHFNREQYARMTELGWLRDDGIPIQPSEALDNRTVRNGNGAPSRRWTLAEYTQMAEWGWFDNVRVMLIDGEILTVPKQKSAHYIAIDKSAETLRPAFGSGFWIRTQAPLDLEDVSDTEPDIAVVKGRREDFADAHPRTAELVVEVSDSTLRYDRGPKASLNARAGIIDYWICNLVDRQLEVFRKPIADASAHFGFRYDEHLVLRPGESIAPLAAPKHPVQVADLLP